MRLSIIVAVAENGAIGRNNDMPWRLSDDLKRFKATTTGHTVVMGRNTFHSLPKGALPNRRNIVLSRTASDFEGAECYSSLADALSQVTDDEEVFIMGGARLYASTIDQVDRLYFTRVHANIDDADTFFPEVDWTDWKEVSRTSYVADDKNDYATTLIVYDRKK